jgi:hypothetical protein
VIWHRLQAGGDYALQRPGFLKGRGAAAILRRRSSTFIAGPRSDLQRRPKSQFGSTKLLVEAVAPHILGATSDMDRLLPGLPRGGNNHSSAIGTRSEAGRFCFAQAKEETMSKESHMKAAEHHDNAAKSHRTAAEHHGKGEHDQGVEHATRAHGQSKTAHEQSDMALRQSRESKK